MSKLPAEELVVRQGVNRHIPTYEVVAKSSGDVHRGAQGGARILVSPNKPLQKGRGQDNLLKIQNGKYILLKVQNGKCPGIGCLGGLQARNANKIRPITTLIGVRVCCKLI